MNINFVKPIVFQFDQTSEFEYVTLKFNMAIKSQSPSTSPCSITWCWGDTSDDQDFQEAYFVLIDFFKRY